MKYWWMGFPFPPESYTRLLCPSFVCSLGDIASETLIFTEGVVPYGFIAKNRNSVVLDQIQLTVKPGEMIGLQGVNGSGKTMLLRLISGLIYPTKGHVLIDGKMLGSDLEFPPSIGFLIENPTFLPQYTGAENLQMLSSLHQMMPTAQIESVLQRVGLHDTKYKKYSLGMKQRLGIAAAVFEQPDIILLDEPTNALDESGITMLENVIQDETSRGATIVMASHDMNFLHHCCSKIYTMRAGTLSL